MTQFSYEQLRLSPHGLLKNGMDSSKVGETNTRIMISCDVMQLVFDARVINFSDSG